MSVHGLKDKNILLFSRESEKAFVFCSQAHVFTESRADNILLINPGYQLLRSMHGQRQGILPLKKNLG